MKITQVPDSLPQIATQIGAVLDELAARFGETGVALWDALVLHRQMAAIGEIISVTLAVILLPIFCVKSMQIARANVEAEAPYIIIGFLAGIGAAAALMVFIFGMPTILATAFAPEAAVLKDLLP